MMNTRCSRINLASLRMAVSVVLLVWASGCGRQGLVSVRQTKTVDPLEAYRNISPLELDPDLTQEAIDKMFVALEDVPYEPVPIEEEESDSKITAPAEPQEDDAADLQPDKMYLRTRWLIKKSLDLYRPDLCQKALDELSKVTDEQHDAGLYLQMADAYFILGQDENALQAARRSIAVKSDNMRAYYLMGRIWLRKNEYARSAWALHESLQCTQATPGNPETPLAWLQKAAALKAWGYLQASAQAYEKSLELLDEQAGYAQTNFVAVHLAGQSYLPLLALAELYMTTGQIEKTVEVLHRGQQLLPEEKDFILAFLKGLTGQKISLQRRYQQVRALCRYMIARDGDSETPIQRYYAACTDMSKYEDYLSDLGQWHQPAGQGKGFLSARLYACGLSLAQQDDQALQILNQLLSSGSQDPKVHRDLARLFLKKNQWQEAIRHYGDYLGSAGQIEQVLQELYPVAVNDQTLWTSQITDPQRQFIRESSPASWFLTGYIADVQNQRETAEQCYRLVLDHVDSGDIYTAAQSHLIELFLEMNRYPDVLNYVNDQSEDVNLLRYAGQASLRLGKTEKAAHYYQEVVRLQGDDLQSYMALAQIHQHRESFARSEEILLQVLDRWPGRQEVYRKLLELYALWDTRSSFNKEWQEEISRRGFEALRYYLQQQYEPEPEQISPDNQKLLVDFSAMAQTHPKGRMIGLILSQLMELNGKGSEGLQQLKRLREYYPEDEKILSLAARFEQNYGDPAQAALLRREIWQRDQTDARKLLQCLYLMRISDQTQPAIELLLSAAQQESWQENTGPIRLLEEETLNLFMVGRDYQQAVELFQRWLEVVQTYYGREEQDAAQQELTDEQLLQKCRENLLWAYTLSNRHEQAAEQLKQMIQNDGLWNNPLILWVLRSLQVHEEYGLEQDVLELIFEKEPEDVSFRIIGFLAEAERGREEQALALAQTWWQQRKDQPKRVKGYVLFLRQMGRYDQAAALLREQIDRHPEQTDFLRQLMDVLIENGSFDQVETLLLKEKARGAETGQWLDTMVKLDVARGLCDQAVTKIQQYQQEHEKPETHLDTIRAEIFQACGDYQQAVHYQKQALDKKPDDPELRLQYSVYLDQMGDKEQALEQLELLLEKFPENSGIQNNLGYLLVEMDRQVDRAERLLKKSLQKAPESAPTLDSMGWLYYKKGLYNEALEYLYQAAALMISPDAEILEHLGDLFYRMDQADRAGRYWQKALEKVDRRLPFNQGLQSDKERLEKKLQQSGRAGAVDVAPLFSDVKQQVP